MGRSWLSSLAQCIDRIDYIAFHCSTVRQSDSPRCAANQRFPHRRQRRGYVPREAVTLTSACGFASGRDPGAPARLLSSVFQSLSLLPLSAFGGTRSVFVPRHEQSAVPRRLRLRLRYSCLRTCRDTYDRWGSKHRAGRYRRPERCGR